MRDIDSPGKNILELASFARLLVRSDIGGRTGSGGKSRLQCKARQMHLATFGFGVTHNSVCGTWLCIPRSITVLGSTHLAVSK